MDKLKNVCDHHAENNNVNKIFLDSLKDNGPHEQRENFFWHYI